MHPSRKKKITFVTIGIYYLLGGVEYAVILPTCWLYIHSRFDAEPWVLGTILSAFSVSGLIAGPLMGKWSDVTGKTKYILLFANLFEIAGSAMYFLGLSPWFLVLSRFVAGFGTGVGSAIMADIARITSVEERTGVMSMLMATRQLGLLIGPGCNLFLRHLHFYIGPFIVDKYTSPGIFMAILWILHEILVIFCYWDLPPLQLKLDLLTAQQDKIDTTGYENGSYGASDPQMSPPTLSPGPDLDIVDNHFSYHSQESCSSDSSPVTKKVSPPRDLPRTASEELSAAMILTASSEMIESAERIIRSHSRSNSYQQIITSDQHSTPQLEQRLRHSESRVSNYGSINGPSHNRTSDCDTRIITGSQNISDSSMENGQDNNYSNKEKLWTWRYYYDEFVREEVIALLASMFISFFNQMALETLVTPLTAKILFWGEFENSLLYIGAAVEILLVFVLIRWLSKKYSDRTLLLLGYAIVTVIIAYMLWYVPQAVPGKPENLPMLMGGVAVDLFGLPFLVVTSTSLYSKITKKETQGFAQGLRRAWGGVGTLMGPLWAGGLLSRPYIMFGVMLAMMCIGMMMLILSFKLLKEKREDVNRNNRKTHHPIDDQSEPLIESMEGSS